MCAFLYRVPTSQPRALKHVGVPLQQFAVRSKLPAVLFDSCWTTLGVTSKPPGSPVDLCSILAASGADLAKEAPSRQPLP